MKRSNIAALAIISLIIAACGNPATEATSETSSQDSLTSQAPAPEEVGGYHRLVIVPDGCPFEGCVLGEWTAGDSWSLFDQPNGAESSAGLVEGERVTAIEGQVHAKAVRAVITAVDSWDEDQGIAIGDTVWVVHSLGEGAVALLQDEILKESSADLMFEYVDPDSEFPESVWWVRVRRADGAEGWLQDPVGFDGMDLHG